MDPTLLSSKSTNPLFVAPIRTAIILLFLTIFSSGAFALKFDKQIFFVKQTGTGSGLAWIDATNDLQSVINASQSGDEIWVAGGTYQPAAGQSFSMKEGVKIYGNFAGFEETLINRNTGNTSNKSILQGNGASVITNLNLTSAALLDCFTVTGGSNGAGIANTSSSPTLFNVIISGNAGGGISNQSSSPVLTRCSITNNTAPLANGGGMKNTSSSPILNSCLITGNSSATGAGIFNSASSPVLTNCTIADNISTALTGGAVYNSNTSAPALRNSIVSRNSSGIHNEAGSSTVMEYSLVQGENNPAPAGHNISGGADPFFVNPAGGDYHLQYCSPVINKGSNAYYDPNMPLSIKDLDGNFRFYSSSVDMGAYENTDNPNAGIAGIWFVKENGTGSGVSWECATSDLQLAINSALSGQQVWVAGGSYRAGQIKAFNMKEGVKIYGGFAGTEESLADRNLLLTANKSTLLAFNSADFPMYNTGGSVTPAALLDGFTLSGGYAGLVNMGSSPTLVNLVITGNGNSGGIRNSSSSPVMINCVIFGNSSTSEGGGMYNSASSPILTNCTISGNSSTGLGGAIYNHNNSFPKIRNSIIHGNSSGIHNEPGSATTIKYSLVQGINAPDPADHNIIGDANPLFVNAPEGNFRLQTCSPALNRGSNDFYAADQTPNISAIATDMDGNTRFFDYGMADLGAYEYQNNAPSGIAGVWYVKVGGTGAGTSWECALGDLQLAINFATSGEQIWVSGGTYRAGLVKAFNMKEGVKIYGGFAGTEESLDTRNLSLTANKSTLLAFNNADFPMYNTGGSVTPAAVLDGFTLSGGYAGLVNMGSSPTLVNLVITGNGNSGGIRNSSSSPVMINCVIFGNSSTSDGGGMCNSASSPILTNCTISSNTSTGFGGAIYNHNNSSPQIRNSIIHGNSSGVHDEPGSTTTFMYSLVQGETGVDPLFVNAGAGDFHLQPCSPAINQGFNYYDVGLVPDLSGITKDLENNLRLFETAVDQGAYELAGTSRELAADGDEATGIAEEDLILTTDGPTCKVLVYLSPNGAEAVNGPVTAKVWIAGTQPSQFVKRHYQITPGIDAEIATSKLILYFTQQEFDDFNAVNEIKLPINGADLENYKLNLRIEKRSGSSKDYSGLPNSYTGTIETITPSEANGGVEWNAAANRWEVSFDVTGFSGFFVKTTLSTLPLHLVSFTATRETGSNLLQWSTASEVNTDQFEVQSSVDAKNFTKIALLLAAGSGEHQYNYSDQTNYKGTIYYRLKMLDRDKSFTYSKIISLTGDGNFAALYPNPAGSIVTFQVNNALLKTTVTLHDITGRRLQSIVITTNQQTVNIRSLVGGLYILRFADGSTEQFVKQ